MDNEGYRLPQEPWFFSNPNARAVEQEARTKAVPKKSATPTQDIRYPGWAAPMNDGRLVTDYRPRCAANIPVGLQFATKAFLQTHAEDIIETSRQRQAEQSGANLSYNSKVGMPAKRYVKCDAMQCYTKDGFEQGLGTERLEAVPELFGTFAPSYESFASPSQPILTRTYEGGRNTPRGVF
jgi:hypothetical protein